MTVVSSCDHILTIVKKISLYGFLVESVIMLQVQHILVSLSAVSFNRKLAGRSSFLVLHDLR